MIACDVNVLVSAHNTADPRHEDYRAWLAEAVTGSAPVALSSIVLSAFIRITTHVRVLARPLTTAQAVAVTTTLLSAPAVVVIDPGPRHWSVFTALCHAVEARGNIVPDAYLAAMAMEHGAEWVTADRGFARFPGLRWRHPLD